MKGSGRLIFLGRSFHLSWFVLYTSKDGGLTPEGCNPALPRHDHQSRSLMQHDFQVVATMGKKAECNWLGKAGYPGSQSLSQAGSGIRPTWISPLPPMGLVHLSKSISPPFLWNDCAHSLLHKYQFHRFIHIFNEPRQQNAWQTVGAE